MGSQPIQPPLQSAGVVQSSSRTLIR
jgi:hypothetical protein